MVATSADVRCLVFSFEINPSECLHRDMGRYLIPITACVFACARIIYTVYNIYTQCHEDEHLHDQWEDNESD